MSISASSDISRSAASYGDAAAPPPDESASTTRHLTLERFFAACARIVLEAVADLFECLGHTVGQGKLVAFLTGGDSDFIRANCLSALPHYGIFRHMRRLWVTRFIEMLREAGYLEVQGAYRPVLTLSEEGDELLLDPEDTPHLPGDVLSDPVVGPSCPRTSLEEKLRHVRASLARLLQRPPRQTISDAVLRILSCGRARSREEVEALLPARARPHADAIWSVVRENDPARAREEPPPPAQAALGSPALPTSP
jgi:hypothetical protein